MAILTISFCQLCLPHSFAQESNTTSNNTSTVTMETPVPETKVTVKTIKHSYKNIYSSKYQTQAKKKLAEFKKGNYTIQKPLVVKNPYGTMSTSLYFYGVAEQNTKMKCTIRASGAETLSYTLVNNQVGNLTTKHEYLITGLVAGKTNHIALQLFDENNQLVEQMKFAYQMPKDKVIPKITKVKNGTSKSAISKGMFAMFGHDKSYATNIYYYDNKGVSRGRTPINGYRTDRILTVDGKWIFSYDINKLAIMNRFGRIEKTISLGRYRLHHDFMYDAKHKKLLVLVNDTKKNTIEDVLISVDPKTKKVKKLVDFSKLMKSMLKLHTQRKGGKNTYGGTELDWLHLNSLDLVDDGNLIVSSREESSLIYNL